MSKALELGFRGERQLYLSIERKEMGMEFSDYARTEAQVKAATQKRAWGWPTLLIFANDKYFF